MRSEARYSRSIQHGKQNVMPCVVEFFRWKTFLREFIASPSVIWTPVIEFSSVVGVRLSTAISGVIQLNAFRGQ